MIEIKIDGLTFDCTWIDEDGDVRLETVSIDGQDLSEIIAHVWWDRIEAAVIAGVKKRRVEDRLEAELDRNEAWGV